MPSLDDVWAEMKEHAGAYARSGVIPSYREAEAVVTSLLDAARLDPKPTEEAVEFYARELIELARKHAS